METITFRKAVSADLPFIIECIVQSEYSGSNILGICAVLDISETSFRNALVEIFDEEIENQPWNLNAWYVAEINGDLAAGLCGWIEGTDGIQSDIVKAQFLQFFFKESFNIRQEALGAVSEITLKRTPGALQLEHLYTLPQYQGKGIMKNLVEFLCVDFDSQMHEIQLLKSNERALSFYEYIGFSVNEIKCNDQVLRLSLLASECKLKVSRLYERRNDKI